MRDEEEQNEAHAPLLNHHECRGGQPKRRVTSLDVFRGLAVALMILVDDAGGVLPAINHSPWNGVTLADFVMPFFLFIVGVSLGLVYKEVSNKVVASRKAILRALSLSILGIVLQGGYFHGLNDLTFGVNIENIRWLGILQRIAIGYFIAALCEIWLKSDNVADTLEGVLKKYRMQWLLAVSLSAVYLVLLYGLYVPDWKFEVQSTNSSNTSSSATYTECTVNSPTYAPTWCQAPFEPEGLLSSIMAAVTCFIGLHFGHILVHFEACRERILHCTLASLGLIIFGGILCILGMPLNKPLYTFNYMCVTSGAAGLIFVGIYLLVDVYGYRRPTMLLEWMGLNALTLYILAACNLFLIVIQGFYWKVPQNNIVTYILQHGPWHRVSSFQSLISRVQSEGL